jgi:L-fuconolactonase
VVSSIVRCSEPVIETALDPALPIVDAHHHLWLDGKGHETAHRYTIEEFRQDTSSGHNIVGTVYVECGSAYRIGGPIHLRPVGETEWAASLVGSRDGLLSGILGYVDLRTGSRVAEVLDEHERAGAGRFRGIRVSAAWDADPRIMRAGHNPDPGLLRLPEVSSAVREISSRGLTLDTWVFHHQLDDVSYLAAANPDCRIVLGHLGGPLAVGAYASERNKVLADWRLGMARLASHTNVYLKLGAIGLPPLVHPKLAEKPQDSATLAGYWHRDILWCIETFGAERCMFESNFPVDRRLCNYAVLWNTFKRITASLPLSERRQLFALTANDVYTLGH